MAKNPRTRTGLFHFEKGSPEARDYMASLRAMRGKGKAKVKRKGKSNSPMSVMGNPRKRGGKKANPPMLIMGGNPTKGKKKRNVPMLIMGNPNGGVPLPAAVYRAVERYKREGERGVDWVFFQDMTQADRDDVDRWLVSVKHMLAYLPGTQENRFRSLVMELAGDTGPAQSTRGKRKFVKRKRVDNPPHGIPPWMWADPRFQAELRAYKRRHGDIPAEIRAIKVPKGFPKFMSVYGQAGHAVYDAPKHSNKGKRIHHFGKKGKYKPWLASSAHAGPKFLAFVGGAFQARPDWIYS